MTRRTKGKMNCDNICVCNLSELTDESPGANSAGMKRGAKEKVKITVKTTGKETETASGDKSKNLMMRKLPECWVLFSTY